MNVQKKMVIGVGTRALLCPWPSRRGSDSGRGQNMGGKMAKARHDSASLGCRPKTS